MKKNIVLFFVLLCANVAFGEQESQILDLRTYLNQAIEATEQEHYDAAIKIYDQSYEKLYSVLTFGDGYKCFQGEIIRDLSNVTLLTKRSFDLVYKI
mgnify:CR=1 FL=1